MDKPYEEICHTIRRVMLALIFFSLFCLVTIGKTDDVLMFTNEGVNVPYTNTPVGYFSFLFIGPLILVGLTIYLHIFIHRWLDLKKKEKNIEDENDNLEVASPPYLFNFDDKISTALSWFLFYWLPPLIIFMFYIKAKPHPFSLFLLFLAIITEVALVLIAYLRFGIKSTAPNITLTAFLFITLLSAVDLLADIPYLDRSIKFKNFSLIDRNLHNYNLNNAYFICTLDKERSSLERCDFSGSDLRNSQFIDVNLMNANFEESKVHKAHFIGKTILKNANFQKAKLKKTLLQDIDLENANFTEAILDESTFTNATLTFAKLINSCGHKVNFSMANLKYSNLSQAKLASAIFISANLANATLDKAILESAKMNGTCLAGASFKETNLSRANLENADLASWRYECKNETAFGRACDVLNQKSKKITDTKDSRDIISTDRANVNPFYKDTQEAANFQNAILKNANCVGVDFRGADLSGADLSGADLSGADLNNADLFFADLRGDIGVDCDALRISKRWYLTYRGTRLKCGEPTLFDIGL